MSARLRPLLTETVIRCLSGSDFTAGELMTGKRPITVYLRVPERELKRLRRLSGSCSPVLLTNSSRRTTMPMGRAAVLF